MENQTLYKTANYWKRQYYFIYWIWLFNVIVFLGLVMNFVAIANNAGKMPVANTSIPSQDYDTHFSFSDPDEIEYYILSDKYRIKGYVYSIGDIFLTVGLLGMFILSILKYRFERRFKKYGKF